MQHRKFLPSVIASATLALFCSDIAVAAANEAQDFNSKATPTPTPSSNPLSHHNEWFVEDPVTKRLILSRDSLYKDTIKPGSPNNPLAKTDDYLYGPIVEEPATKEVHLGPRNLFNIPAPNLSVNYGRNTKFVDQGNTFLQISESHMYDQIEEKQEPINPLASPDYDPFTGQIVPKNKPEEVKEEILPLTPDEEIEARLNKYAQDRLAEAKKNRAEKPFGDFFAHDELYHSFPKTADFFYLDRSADRKKLTDAIAEIEKNLDADLSFVVLGDLGIIALKDNTEYPLTGLLKFYLSYAVASLMHTRGDDLKQQVYFNTNTLKRNVISPFAEMLLSAVGSVVAKDSGVEVYDSQTKDVKRGGQAYSTAERSKAIAKSAQSFSDGEKLPSAREGGVRHISAVENDIFQKKTTLENLQNEGKVTSLAIADLIYYSLGYSDPNAFDVLISYLGTLPSLELFVRSKSLQEARINALETEVAATPELGYENRAPLYETAKLYALYLQDKGISPEVREFIDEIMYFNVSSKEGIQKGVANSIARDSEEDRATLKVYSREGVGEVNSIGKRVSVSDLSYIQYKDQQYIMLIELRDIGGDPAKSRAVGEKAIAYTAKALFEYLNERNKSDEKSRKEAAQRLDATVKSYQNAVK